ncbi:DUF5723 family protein [Paracrocinitomix mangrovi]|uniref:DUF5723 family protein n=1 Tax=Paracrocinitomix mangrovi TaxID=2862509 RepID=UPI001C8DD987|nr:DUF5723 family protein [Paracrocinitomix mangrovi]UKN02678.1 DUF5723 family protein [Paracrocinitomix mangrovi]
MKKILTLAFIATSIFSFSQNEYIAWPATGKGVASTFVSDYHCLGINPANLGWRPYDQKSVTMGTSEFGISFYSESLAKQDLRDNLWGIVVNKSLDSLTREDKIAAAKGFASDFAFNWDYNMFGIAYQNEKFGGIAFSLRSRATWASSFSSTFSETLFRGKFSSQFDSLSYFNGVDTTMVANYENMSPDSAQNVLSGSASIPLNISDFVGDSYLRLSVNREFHLGYGRKLFGKDSTFALYAGVGAKYIQGIAMMQLQGDSASGTYTMISSFSPGFDIDYGTAAIGNPSALVGQAQNIWRSPVGYGFGFDFGVRASILGKLHLAASVTNIGSMKYTGNVYEGKDTLVVNYSASGLEDMNISNSIPELLEESGLFELKGIEETTIKLPGQVRFGASLELGKIAHVGVDLVAPFDKTLPGSVNGFAWGMGGDVIIPAGKSQIFIMAGLTGGGGYDLQLPVGINFVLGEGAYEVGVASRDAVTFFAKNTPTISAAFGFARVRF